MDQKRDLHIVTFPWLAFGHMLPYLEFSKHLATKGNRVSFISTPNNIKKLPKIPADLAPLLTFVEIPLPQDDPENLPNGAEATTDIPNEKVQYLKKAFDGLEPLVLSFLQSSSPDWIICDFAPHWLPPIASQLHIPCAYLSIYTASTLSFIGPLEEDDGTRTSGTPLTKPEDFTVPPKWIPFPSNMAFRMFEILRILNSSTENASGVSDVFRMKSVIEGADIVAVRSSHEFEAEWLGLLQNRLFCKPVIPIGLLPPRVQLLEDDMKWTQIREWLDTKDNKSVVYVAFGSEAVLSEDETTELALGLELSGLPFFWVWRTPLGASESKLPDGFEDRVKGRGFICRTWAPQLQILSHRSIGGFLTHSGWSSVIEALSLGCPLVLFPIINDQAFVARLLEWKKIALEIPRNEEDGFFTRELVSKTLRKVVVEEEGESYRAKATEWKLVFGDHDRQSRYIDEFQRQLRDHTREW